MARRREDQRDDRDSGPGQAGAWVALLASGHAIRDDAERLRLWRAQSPDHEAAYRAAVRLWRDLGSAIDAPAAPPAAVSRRRVLAGGAAVALSAGGVMVGGQALGLIPPLADGATHMVATGGRDSVALAAGGRADLDGGTRIALDPGGADLRLIAGAAAVTLPAGPGPGLRLEAAHWTARAEPGAEFAVTLGQRTDCLECLAGAVLADGQTLTPGQRILRDHGGATRLEEADPATMASWRAGYLVFRDRRLGDVIADLNRHRPGRIVILAPAVNERLVSGVFHLDRPDEVLVQIQEVFGLRSLRMGQLVMVS